ncbi:MAG: hypothetical protein JXR63_11015 [Spirochaetales bacterium]|nr:hypothetical protein [Spirochaetales bacterium]
MVKEELIKRSPLRIFEKSIHGGLGEGNIGVIFSKEGVGKTACLVHIATDKLLQGKHVIHVSFSQRVNHVMNWYDDIFNEIAKKRDLESARVVHDQILKNRVVMNFSQEAAGVAKVLKSLKLMIEQGHFAADAVIIDGLDLKGVNSSDLSAIKEFSKESNCEVWVSVSLEPSQIADLDGSVPKIFSSILNEISVLIKLETKPDHIHFEVLKDREDIKALDMNLKLDPATLLIAEL